MLVNQVVIAGEVLSANECNGLYELKMKVERPSGEVDEIDILSHDKLFGFCRVYGEVRSRQEHGLRPYVFAEELEKSDEEYINEGIIEGYICQKPFYKKLRTREVTAFMIAVDGKRTYYIPAVCWGKTARRVRDYEEGRKVVIKGRCQTRHYLKGSEDKLAREISAYDVI